MGVYSLNSINEASSFLDDVEVQDIYTEDFMEAALQNVYEITCNSNAMMKSIGIAELAVYESTGEEIIYEAGTLAGLFAKIKAALKKIWEKIKSLFTKFLAKIQSFGKDDKAFVTKYKKEILAGSTKDLNVKGFIFNTDAIKPEQAKNNMVLTSTLFKNLVGAILTGNVNAIVQLLSKTNLDTIEKDFFGDSESEFNDQLRAASIGQKGEMDSTEFNKELFEMFRKGESKPQTLDDTDINKGDLIHFLMNSSTIENDINKDMKAVKKTLDEYIKAFDKMEREVSKVQSGMSKDEINIRSKMASFISRASRHIQESLNIIQVISGARMKAFNDKRKQYKSICVKLIGRKAKNEGYEYEDEFDSYNEDSTFESILGNVKFI